MVGPRRIGIRRTRRRGRTSSAIRPPSFTAPSQKTTRVEKGQKQRKCVRIGEKLDFPLGLKCDMVMYGDEKGPYIRLFSGKKKLAEISLFQITEEVICSFLSPYGISSETALKILAFAKSYREKR